MQSMIQRLKSMKRRPGVDEILVPGERSERTMRENLTAGIFVDEETVAELQKWCLQYGIDFNAEKAQAQTRA
jgi:LDH2 family malate/lactate/ureidoglycolate dehydrogenase